MVVKCGIVGLYLLDQSGACQRNILFGDAAVRNWKKIFPIIVFLKL